MKALLLSSQTLTICIEGIKNTSGVIRLAFYQSDEEFRTDKPFRNEILKKNSLQNGSMCVDYSDLKAGTYGIALLDDENENFRMDYKLLLPQEGFGFSNFSPDGLKRPKFKDFKFNLDEVGEKITIQVKYML